MVEILKDNVQQIYFVGCEEVAPNVVEFHSNVQHSLQGFLERNKCFKLRWAILTFAYDRMFKGSQLVLGQNLTLIIDGLNHRKSFKD